MSNHSGQFSRRTLFQFAGASAAAGTLLSGTQLASGQATPSGSASPAAGVSGGTLTFGSGKPSENIINPLNTVGSGQNVLIEALFLRLIYGREWTEGMNPPDSGDVELAVAESMKELEPDQAWEIKLRENVYWHDGEPVTADDVIFGIWMSLNKNTGSTNETPVIGIKGGEKLQDEGAEVGDIVVEGATKIDDYTLRIELEKPIANYWKSWYNGYWPMPQHIFGDMPFDKLYAEPYATMPVGNGPFKAVKYVDGQYMEMEANEDFYLGRPLLDKFIVRFGDGDTLTAALEAQEIDGTNTSAGPAYDRLVELPYIEGVPVPVSHPNGIITNFDRFGDEAAEINKAIMHAIDIETISQQLSSGTLLPSNNLFEHIPGYEENPEGWVNYDYDPDAATQILQDIGWDTNTTLEWLIIGSPNSTHDAIQAMLAQVGLKAEYRMADPASAIDEMYRNSNFDIVMANFGGFEFFEENWRYFKCGWDYASGGFNFAQYCNEEVDELFEQGLAEVDSDKQKDLFNKANLLLNAKPPQATLFRGSITYVWNSRVQGAYPYQYRLPVRPPFERVWIDSQ